MKFSLFLLSAILLAQTLALSYSPTANVCLLPSQPRGRPQSLSVFNSCDERMLGGAGEYCLLPCAPGYTSNITSDCWKDCPRGATLFSIDGTCDQPLIGERYGPFTSMVRCEYIHEKCSYYQGRYIPDCSGVDIELSWSCKTEKGTRESLPARKHLGCVKGYDLVNGICYPKCSDGYRGEGTVCVSGQCPARYTQCGKYCVKGSYCQNSQIESFEAFLTSVQRNSAQVDSSKYLC